jgi:FkbM family methyltransferase
LARVSFKLSIQNAIINRRARGIQQMETAAESRLSSSKNHAGSPSANQPISSAANQPPSAPSSQAPAQASSTMARDAVRFSANQASSVAANEAIAEQAPRTVVGRLFSPTKRVLKRIRNMLLTPLHTQLDGLQLLTYALHEKFDDAQGTVYALHEKMDDILYSLHEKLDEAHVKLDDAHSKLDEMHRKLEEAHVETTVRLGQMDELTKAIHSRLEEVAMRARTPLQIDGSTFSFRTYDGFVLIPSSDSLLLLMLLDAGPQGLEPGTRSILMKLLVPGMTFIDVGAHIGLLTLAGARAVGAKGKVLAIEPTPLVFKLLNRALFLNQVADRVVTKCLAAGERRQRAAFYIKAVLGHSSLIASDRLDRHNADKIDVEVVPLDDLVPPGERVDVVKIDVEGAELDVLRGMSRIIRDNPDLAIIVEFAPSHLKASMTNTEQWFSSFRAHGFDGYAIDELSGECLRVEVGEIGAIDSVNILFVRPSSLAISRVF